MDAISFSRRRAVATSSCGSWIRNPVALDSSLTARVRGWQRGRLFSQTLKWARTPNDQTIPAQWGFFPPDESFQVLGRDSRHSSAERGLFFRDEVRRQSVAA